MSAALSLLPCVVLAQTNPAAQAGRKWRQAHERAIIDEFVSLLSIPNIARDRENIQRNAEAIARCSKKRSIPAKLVVGSGRRIRSSSARSARRAPRERSCFYAHYDGQPLDPKEWSSAAVRADVARWAARKRRQGHSAAGCRTRFRSGVAHCTRGRPRTTRRRSSPSWRPLTRSAQPVWRSRSNIKFAFEGEEEAGSANLEKILAANKDLFAGDVWLMCDGAGSPDAAAVNHLRRAQWSHASISPSMGRERSCTAVTMATGRPIRR